MHRDEKCEREEREREKEFLEDSVKAVTA